VREVILPTGEPLVGERVRLDVLRESDVEEMSGLLGDPDIYSNGYVMHRRPTTAEDSRALADGLYLGRPGRTTYAIRLMGDGALGGAGTLVGTSSLMDADLTNERIHLGSTMYGRRWWGTVVNPEAKLLLLGHCFDDCGYGRVKIQTDALNTRSQAAIAKLGAQREGVLRRHMRREDGTFRDTVVFSILAVEWPAVRSALQARLLQFRGDEAQVSTPAHLAH
jgi:RimJ/RimL family protein N-acetyltransferase